MANLDFVMAFDFQEYAIGAAGYFRRMLLLPPQLLFFFNLRHHKPILDIKFAYAGYVLLIIIDLVLTIQVIVRLAGSEVVQSPFVELPYFLIWPLACVISPFCCIISVVFQRQSNFQLAVYTSTLSCWANCFCFFIA